MKRRRSFVGRFNVGPQIAGGAGGTASQVGSPDPYINQFFNVLRKWKPNQAKEGGVAGVVDVDLTAQSRRRRRF